MERLTDKKSGNPICSEQGGLGVSAKFIRRLAEYENTELAPDEISILNVQGYVNWSRSEKKVKLETIEETDV